MSRRFKEILAAGDTARVFSVGRLLHPVVIDLFGLAGQFDGFWMDQEHAGLTYQEIQLAAVCARANGFDCIVRLPPTNYAQVTQHLEAGAGGVMAAQVHTAAQAEEFVRWAKFAPRGMRGMNTSGRDGHYTHRSQAEFAQIANREHLVAIQVETAGAVEQADQIAAIDGVDLLFIGPADLSQSLGILGQANHPRLWEAIDRVANACQRHGKHWGTVPADPAFAEKCHAKGCRMLSLAADVLAVRRGIEALKAAHGKFFSGE